MENEEILSTRQSLDLITEMINRAKGNIMQNSVYFIIWGLVIAIANLGMFTLIQLDIKQYYLVWAITIPAWIFTIYHSYTGAKRSKTSTHLDRISGSLWLGFGVIIFTLVPFGNLINYQLNPVILLISALPTLVSGIIIRFKPLIIGGISFWILAITCFLVHGPWQFIIGAMAVTVGFFIPGMLLKKIRHV